jgi:hypothetical protein
MTKQLAIEIVGEALDAIDSVPEWVSRPGSVGVLPDGTRQAFRDGLKMGIESRNIEGIADAMDLAYHHGWAPLGVLDLGEHGRWRWTLGQSDPELDADG